MSYISAGPVIFQDLNLFKLLLKNSRFDINEKYNNKTTLHYACQENKIDIVEIDLYTKDINEFSAFDYACVYWHSEIFFINCLNFDVADLNKAYIFDTDYDYFNNRSMNLTKMYRNYDNYFKSIKVLINVSRIDINKKGRNELIVVIILNYFKFL